MSLRYSDLHLQILVRGLLDPGEHLTGHAIAVRNPWYGLGFLSKQYLLVSTDRRLLVLEHERSFLYTTFVLSKVESYLWANVEELQLRGLLAKRVRLVARTANAVHKLVMHVPAWFAAVRDNGRSVRAVVATFQAQRALAPGSSPNRALPATSFSM
ncbi:hypothetical protein AKJ09_03589 [Labilithrix luteola]|uniref:YokE-like PH domain-containing protein n=1 Tax=Labilithrix luteola TaxID=1391654 RepID=A0A0K1PTR6_9BACT|nr:hypothetical protein [Labilithrix luteola]AKU96925.1 hypothetical protein AKJ09_03589 [Labilithrix luteola]